MEYASITLQDMALVPIEHAENIRTPPSFRYAQSTEERPGILRRQEIEDDVWHDVWPSDRDIDPRKPGFLVPEEEEEEDAKKYLVFQMGMTSLKSLIEHYVNRIFRGP